MMDDLKSLMLEVDGPRAVKIDRDPGWMHYRDTARPNGAKGDAGRGSCDHNWNRVGDLLKSSLQRRITIRSKKVAAAREGIDDRM